MIAECFMWYWSRNEVVRGYLNTVNRVGNADLPARCRNVKAGKHSLRLGVHILLAVSKLDFRYDAHCEVIRIFQQQNIHSILTTLYLSVYTVKKWRRRCKSLRTSWQRLSPEDAISDQPNIRPPRNNIFFASTGLRTIFRSPSEP